MFTWVTAMAWVAALVLVVAGGAKLARPTETTPTLRRAGLPSWSAVARALGVVEVAVGASVLISGGRITLAALALVYLGLAVFAGAQRRHSGSSCGCFGSHSAPLTRRHVAINAVSAAAAATAALSPQGSGAEVLRSQGAVVAVLSAVLLAAAAWLVQLHLTAVPRLQAAAAPHLAPEGSSR
jgi:uncharacterized membrane protein YphA (DoxX/SURF4 family)